jgi:hypothetical protein
MIYRARCFACGPVHVVDGDAKVLVCADDLRTAIAFRCPGCGGQVIQLISTWVADRLANAGVAVVVWQLPAELFEPHPDGPPFTHDDLLDFHQAISQRDWLARSLDELRR